MPVKWGIEGFKFRQPYTYPEALKPSAIFKNHQIHKYRKHWFDIDNQKYYNSTFREGSTLQVYTNIHF